MTAMDRDTAEITAAAAMRQRINSMCKNILRHPPIEGSFVPGLQAMEEKALKYVEMQHVALDERAR